MIRSLFEGCIRNISGPIGIKVRRWYYTRRLKTCGTKLTVSEGVYFDNPSCISLGDFVWVDRGSKLIAGKIESENVIQKESESPVPQGFISIGDEAHIGVDTILQGHGGISIGNNFTSSPSTKIYSLSNDVKKSKHGTNSKNTNNRFYISSPILIANNVWFGVNTLMVSGQVEDDTFIQPNSIVNGRFPKNSVIGGNPAVRYGDRF